MNTFNVHHNGALVGVCRRRDPVDPAQTAAARRVLQRRYDALGPMTFQERAVVTLLCVLVALWFFREPEFMPGWNELFTET